MTPLEIQIGTRLELEWLNENGEKIGNTFVSQLLEQQEDASLAISTPIFESKLIMIPLQAQLRLIFMHHKLGLLGFTAIVTSKELKDNIAVLIVRPEDSLEKIQRRTHYRLDCMANILIRLNEKESKGGSETAIKAFTKNISGSGLCVITEVNIPENSEVAIEVRLSENVIIVARCIVIRNIWFEVKKTKSYELGLHFVDISQKNRDSLIKFIYEQQRLQLRKGI